MNKKKKFYVEVEVGADFYEGDVHALVSTCVGWASSTIAESFEVIEVIKGNDND